MTHGRAGLGSSPSCNLVLPCLGCIPVLVRPTTAKLCQSHVSRQTSIQSSDSSSNVRDEAAIAASVQRQTCSSVKTAHALSVCFSSLTVTASELTERTTAARRL